MSHNKNLEYKKLNKDECLVCFDEFKWYHTEVVCCLCNNKVHYKCYKKFIKKNINYTNKCFHCGTKSIYFNKPCLLCVYL